MGVYLPHDELLDRYEELILGLRNKEELGDELLVNLLIFGLDGPLGGSCALRGKTKVENYYHAPSKPTADHELNNQLKQLDIRIH
jgi:hypothetical protein